MDTSDFSKMLQALVALSSKQRHQLSARLDDLEGKNKELEANLMRPKDCPHCHASAEHLRPWGQSHGLARMRCYACGKTSNALTATPLAHLRWREQWLRYGQALIDGLSVRQAAQRCSVNKSTAFRWRHRFLQAAAGHRVEHEAGIVEADETFFLESFKGQRHLYRPARKRGGTAQQWERIPVLVVRDRSGQTADFRLERVDTQHIAAALGPLVEKDAVLCTDGATVYQAATRLLGLRHEAVNLTRGIRVKQGVFHIQNVNAYDIRLKEWMRRFHGVASKYLENYLGWRRLLERYRQAITPVDCLHEAIGRHSLQHLMRT